jgi:nucleotide-binding universal stress UspA family protein
MKILIAIDDSSSSAPAVLAAVHRPWPPNSVFRILRVIDVQAPFEPELAVAANFIETQTALRRDAGVRVQEVRETVAKTGLSVETRIREGDAGRQIVEEAKEWGADLILMGSHGRTGLKRVLMGSVAHYVVSHAPCSVEVVRRAGVPLTAQKEDRP